MKRRYFRQWLEQLLIAINCFIFCFMACINDFTSKGLLIIIILILVFMINAKLLKKYSKLLNKKED